MPSWKNFFKSDQNKKSTHASFLRRIFHQATSNVLARMAISRGRIEKGERKKSRLNFFSSSSSFSPPTRHQLHSYILFNSCQPCRSLFPLPRTDRSRPMNISRVSQINAFVYKYSSSARNALTFGSRPDRHRSFSSLRSILPEHLRQIDRARKYRRGNEPVNNEPFPSLTTRLLLRSRDS